MTAEKYSDWNEFKWEKEIRDDENRIHCYFQELMNFIDLPDEEKMILERMEQTPGMVASNASVDDFNNTIFTSEEDYLDALDDFNSKAGSSLFFQLEKLACRWSDIFAGDLNEKTSFLGMSVLCRFGKIIARVGDTLNHYGEKYPAFKTSIYKRVNGEINFLIGDILKINSLQPELKKKNLILIDHLQNAREKIIDSILHSKKKTD